MVQCASSGNGYPLKRDGWKCTAYYAACVLTDKATQISSTVTDAAQQAVAAYFARGYESPLYISSRAE